MAEEQSESGSTVIHGRQAILPNGAKVWGGLREGGVVWKFTSVEGGVTTLALSDHAMHAVFGVYQGLLGCDEDFARVTCERSTPSPTSDA